MKKRYLVLQNGRVFEGAAAGAEGEVSGELVFTTAMGGYMETLTDPCFYGQIVMQTFPLTGNYGAIPADGLGECKLCGYIAGELCEYPSNFRCEGTVNDYLVQNGVVAVTGIDTREVTKLLRECGTMCAALCDLPEYDFKTNQNVYNAVEKLSCKNIKSIGSGRHRIAVLDYGAAGKAIAELSLRDTQVTVLPFNTPAEVILKGGYHGLVLSDGPGDPAKLLSCTQEIAILFGKLPIFGISLGHLLLASAVGNKVEKMKYGHRGVNQPAKQLSNGKTFVTTQNHGFLVATEKLAVGQLSFVNANDNSCEGIAYPDNNAFSVQFVPESNSGTGNTGFLFDEFIALTEKYYAL